MPWGGEMGQTRNAMHERAGHKRIARCVASTHATKLINYFLFVYTSLVQDVFKQFWNTDLLT